MTVGLCVNITAYRSLTKCYKGDQIKENEMGGACSTYGKGEM